MKIISKNESIERKNSELCIVKEYPMGDTTIDFAIVNINGQYPKEKFAVNKKCKELVYVQKGSGELIINDKKHQLKEGDLILIEVNEKFVWNGIMTLYISCHPSFTVDQHQIVD